MKIIISIFAVIGILVVLFLIGVAFKTYKKIRKDINAEYREFSNAVELMQFIRTVYECKIEHKVPMYGFVGAVSKETLMMENGLSDTPTLEVEAHLVTRQGHQKVSAPCGNLDATLKKGDFVAVLPIFNERHGLWYYVTIAKLETIYLGKNRGFLVKEQYID